MAWKPIPPLEAFAFGGKKLAPPLAWAYFAAAEAKVASKPHEENAFEAPTPANANGLLDGVVNLTEKISHVETKSKRTSSEVLSSSHKPLFMASGPNQVSPVATSSMFSDGRLVETKPLNNVKTSSISFVVLIKSSLVIFFVGVIVRLYLPAVIVANSIPSFFKRS